jgi:tetrahydromethanopterin S-methyltransferase subunit G
MDESRLAGLEAKLDKIEERLERLGMAVSGVDVMALPPNFMDELETLTTLGMRLSELEKKMDAIAFEISRLYRQSK